MFFINKGSDKTQVSSEPRRDFLKKSSLGSFALFVGFNSNGLLATTNSVSKDISINHRYLIYS